jgi:ABC-type Zn uptake system ZnuABC Zn-binding protein ZnuA
MRRDVTMFRISILFIVILLPFVSQATVRVVTTLPDLADITNAIGGERVNVDNIVRGDQNPHFIEVKPSYMMKVKRADIFIMVGMELELWALQIIDGSRNDRLDIVDLSTTDIEKLEVPTRVDRSQGDVHRFGNPHYWLDPRNIPLIAEAILHALVKAAPDDEPYFRENMAAYLATLETKIAQWEELIAPLAGAKIITFHSSWSYFARWLNITVSDQVEPKPGIPPSPSHTAELIDLVNEGEIRAIVVAPFYDLSAPAKIAQETTARVVILSTSVGGVNGTDNYMSMMDYNVRALYEAIQR